MRKCLPGIIAGLLLLAACYFVLLITGALTPVYAKPAECRTPAQLIAIVAHVAIAYRTRVDWYLRPPERNRQALLVQFPGQPADVHLFVDGCFTRTVKGPILTVPRVET